MLHRLAPASIYDPPSLLYTLLTQPVKTLVRFLDLLFNSLRTQPSSPSSPLRVVCISDTHCLKADSIPDGDLLIHAGDLTNAGSVREIQAQIDWLASLPHEHKVVIAGNHDRFLDPRSRGAIGKYVTDEEKEKNNNNNETASNPTHLNWHSLHYLQHTTTTLTFPPRAQAGARTLKIHGAPQTPTNARTTGPKDHDFAFRYPYASDAWTGTIPPDTDILITHGPPKYHLDLPAALGCAYLLREIWRVRPRVHVFGHIHAGRSDFVGRLKGGREVVRWDAAQGALERALGRGDGFLVGLLNPFAWWDVLRVVFYGLVGVLWERVWGGAAAERSTVMVLASLMFCSSGRLGNAAQVVEI